MHRPWKAVSSLALQAFERSYAIHILTILWSLLRRVFLPLYDSFSSVTGNTYVLKSVIKRNDCDSLASKYQVETRGDKDQYWSHWIVRRQQEVEHGVPQGKLGSQMGDYLAMFRT